MMFFYSQSVHVRQTFLGAVPDSTPAPSSLSRFRYTREHIDAFNYAKRQFLVRFPLLNVNFIDAVEDAQGRTVITINGYTSEEHYKKNKEVNFEVSKLLTKLQKENPTFF